MYVPRRAVLGVLVLLAGGCDTNTPVPGELDVLLKSPQAAEGAAVFEVDGPLGVSETINGGSIYAHTAGSVTRVIVILDQGGQIHFRMSVADVHQPPVVRIVEVAAPTNQLRGSLDGYRVDFSPVR